METLTVDPKDVDLRLDKLLVQHYPTYSRTYFQYLIEEKAILVNGESVKKRETLKAGDEIEICFLFTPELSASPEAIPLDILYEDEDLIAINKPAGLVVHPAPGSPNGTFANALLHHCKNLPFEEPLRPGIVHRLDKDTTGVLIAAKTYAAHQALIAAFSSRKIHKKYLAICYGAPKEGLLSAPIKRHPIHRQQMTVAPDGKEALSHFTILKQKDPFSLVEVDLLTGRTHQIRVHLKYLKTPIIGDPLYGSSALNEKYKIQRQLLHAQMLVLNHPITGKPLEIKALVPSDMQKFIDQIEEGSITLL